MALGGLGRLLAVARSLGVALSVCGADGAAGAPQRKLLLDGELAIPAGWYCSNGSEYPGGPRCRKPLRRHHNPSGAAWAL